MYRPQVSEPKAPKPLKQVLTPSALSKKSSTKSTPPSSQNIIPPLPDSEHLSNSGNDFELDLHQIAPAPPPKLIKDPRVRDARVPEPLDYKKDTERENRKIDKINKKRLKNFKAKVKDKKNKIEGIRAIMRNLPVAPEQPKIYDFEHKDVGMYPIDFDMKTYQLLSGEQRAEEAQQAQYINSSMVEPLQQQQEMLKHLRDSIKSKKLLRSKLRSEIVEMEEKKLERDEEDDDEDSDEEDPDQEMIDLKQSALAVLEEEINKLKDKIEETKNIIRALKFKIVEMLKNLAEKEYMTNPDSIFSFPHNNKIKHYTKEVKIEMGQLEQLIRAKLEKPLDLKAPAAPLEYKGRLQFDNEGSDSSSDDSSSSSSS